MIISKKFEFFRIAPLLSINLLPFVALLEPFCHVAAKEKHKNAKASKDEAQRSAPVRLL